MAPLGTATTALPQTAVTPALPGMTAAPAAGTAANPYANPYANPAVGAQANPALAGAQTGAAAAQQNSVWVNTSSLSSAITGLTQVVASRQKYLAAISVEIAKDAQINGTPNQVALARLNMEASTAALLSEQTKKLYDTLEQSIRSWTRP